jgi:hypothetical protein
MLIVRMTATSIPWYIISQEAMIVMVDCVEGGQDGAMQQQATYLCRIAMEQATIAKA